METETVTSQCKENNHESCAGYYASKQNCRIICECSCHKKLTWEETIPRDVYSLQYDPNCVCESCKRVRLQAKTSWEARQPEIDQLKTEIEKLRQDYREIIPFYNKAVDLALEKGRKEVVEWIDNPQEIVTWEEQKKIWGF